MSDKATPISLAPRQMSDRGNFMNRTTIVGTIVIIGLMLLCLTGKAEAGDGISCYEARARLYQRVDDLERENRSLARQVSQLQSRLYQDQKLRSRSRSPYGYGYGQSPLYGANRSLQDAN